VAVLFGWSCWILQLVMYIRDALVDSIVSCCVPDMIGVYLKACEVRLLAVMVLTI
jgi:hypothetical protein